MTKFTMISTIIAVLLATSATVQPVSAQADRIDCKPFGDLTESDCLNAGCLWDPLEVPGPWCYLPGPDRYGYLINGNVEVFPGNRGFKVDLRRIDGTPSLYGDDMIDITFQVDYYSDNTMAFAFYAKGSDLESRRPPVSITLPSTNNYNNEYYVELGLTQIGLPFIFRIIRQSTRAVIFDTSMGGLTLADQFLMISTKLPTRYLYGFGENTHDTFLHDMNYRMWPIFARDQAPDYDDVNLYGAHPFYMVSEEDGSSHGVFFYNSHAMDVTTMPAPGLTLRTIGGNLEFFVFFGPTPEQVVQQYTALIGRPFMPAYWSLGFQISRWGYRNTDHIKEVIDRTKFAGIPHDVQYADIDYMDGRRDFTVDPIHFGDLPQLIRDVKNDGLRFIVILDPAIAIDYPSYENGKALDVYIKWDNETTIPDDQPSDLTLLGNVWPDNKTAFPDFFKESTKTWWTDEIRTFYENVKFDGLWIDMNEVSNFDTNVYEDKLQCPENRWDDPPYGTMAAHIGPKMRLSDRTICMVTRQGAQNQYHHYDVHSLYGYSQSIATQSTVREVTGKRSMVLSRSTFSGSGKYTGHWLGDNFSRWSNLGDSIIGMMEFNLFGMPYIGADICGFIFNTTEEMCQRWSELGAFYPFSRNHNIFDALDQDPGVWPTVATSARNSLVIRYRLLPYLYTLFHLSHTTGTTVVRPLYHEYPRDMEVRHIDRQFLWGSAFMVTPVLEEGKTSVDAYVPDDVWYDFHTGSRVQASGFVTLAAPLGFINLHIRGGHILPAQKPALNTMESRQNNFELLVALKDGRADGQLFWDDGESIDTYENQNYQINTFVYEANTLKITSTQGGGASWSGISQKMDLIVVMGLQSRPNSITANGTVITSYSFDEEKMLLTIDCSLDMNVDWVIAFQ